MASWRLMVEEGYNRGTEYLLDAPEVSLGRAPDCAVQLLDDGVSRRHARLVRDGLRARVEDLGSRNRTLLNGVPVAKAELRDGDRLSLGNVRFAVFLNPGGVELEAGKATLNLSGPLRRELRPGREAAAILGDSPGMTAVLAQLARVAPTASNVLVLGESGTGKELVARALHRLSRRRHEAFVVLNGAALQPSLVESELFGHEKGAFTGATARKQGLVEAADGGTLFLDEVGELEPGTQAKLLRFIESGEFSRLGATSSRRVDVRLVAATHRDVDAMVEDGSFRADLLFRLRVVELRLPPLRERGDDVLTLARDFLAELCGERLRLSEAACAILRAHRWPGNVRELRNAVEAAAILCAGPEVLPEDLPERVRAGAGGAGGSADPALLTLEQAERRAIERALAHFEGHRSKTARFLGIDRKTLYHKLKHHGI